MPLGLKKARLVISEANRKCFEKFTKSILLIYIDDVIVFTDSLQQHQTNFKFDEFIEIIPIKMEIYKTNTTPSKH